MTSVKPEISVVICTFNPRPDYLARALRSIGAQTLAPSRFEVIIIDNNSSPPLAIKQVERLVSRKVSLSVELRQGLVYARVAGFRAASTDVLVFVDDDNELQSDYLENALYAAHAEPKLGVFGGRCIGAFEKKVRGFKTHYLPHLGVRDLGMQPLTGSGRKWGKHEPIGAGIVVRSAVGAEYIKLVEEQPLMGKLGRSGEMLMSGEDSLISRIAADLGLECGYRPDLCLRHNIPARRVTTEYLKRLLIGHGYSYVLLETILGNYVGKPPKFERRARIANFLHRLRAKGPAEALGMFYWDIGYMQALNERPEWLKALRANEPSAGPSPERMTRPKLRPQ